MMRRLSISLPSTRWVRSVIFTEHSPVLATESKAKGYDSNLWVEEFLASNVGVTVGESATTIVGPKVYEFVNLSQCATDKVTASYKKEPEGHSSVSTQRLFSSAFNDKLEAIAKERNFTSKWWVNPNRLEALKLQLREGERPQPVYASVKLRVFNVCQLQNRHIYDFHPISSSSGSFYTKNTAEFDSLVAFNKSLEAPVGLMFTARRLEELKLKLKPNVTPIKVSISAEGSRFTLFSVEDLENYEQILASLNRTVNPPTVSYLMTGRVLDEKYHAAFAARQNKYVISGREVVLSGWKLREGAVPVNTGKPMEYTSYSVQQLEDPSLGFAAAITKR